MDVTEHEILKGGPVTSILDVAELEIRKGDSVTSILDVAEPEPRKVDPVTSNVTMLRRTNLGLLLSKLTKDSSIRRRLTRILAD
ncbi:hypothetical protein J19TS2_61970 [Cohnella xylanilytica]|nr:hypothetical protein J19TS2_61970 [Cohnella xylanilytica]